MPKPLLNRRTFLRGLGGVAVAMPFLDCMSAVPAWAGPDDPPMRCLTMFFGLGIPKTMQAEGFAGPLGPLQRHQAKLAMFRNVSMKEAGGSGHPPGGTCVFVGKGGPNGERSGGASIDQVVKRALHPGGVPTALGTLATGNFFRRSHGLYQRIRCWNPDGSRVLEPIEDPAKLFASLFGGTDPGDAVEARKARLRRSVLDSVIDDYRHMTQDRAGLGVTSTRRLQDHLDRVRELERKVYPEDQPTDACEAPDAPNAPDLPYGFAGATEYQAVKVNAADFQRAYRLNAELMAMAFQCDLVRFGNLMFESSGGHTAFKGTYESGGQAYNFRSEASDHNNWHEARWNDVRWHAHWFQSNIAAALDFLDDAEFPDENGKTILDNALVVLGTETGTNHDMDGVFHAVSSAGGRLKVGGFVDEDVRAVEIYNTCLQALEVDSFMGSAAHYRRPVSALTP